MEDKTFLLLTYGKLKDMLEEFQLDGLMADGQGCALRLDPRGEIIYEITHGTIEVFYKKEEDE